MKIEVKDLCYRAGGKEILDHVTVTFEGNCICGIIGPNGSGKTTLLRHIYRELPSHGRIYMDGTDISEIPRRVYARKLAVMMQHQDLFESDLKVHDVVMTGRYPYKSLFSDYGKKDEELVRRILEENALSSMQSRSLSTLSGGELQRVMISRCFAQEPDVILLDEPTNHLDVRYKVELMKTLSRFPGLVIMTLHDLGLAAQYCDEIYLFDRGRVIRRGKTEEIFRGELLREVFQTEIRVHYDNGHTYIGI